jgi:GNAT superfamily N-acetyltransferase
VIVTARGNDRDIAIEPLTPDRWDDLVGLFGPKGAQDGCWCMWWRLAAKEWKENQGEGNKAALRSLVEAGQVPGLIAYVDGGPAGWISLGPRECFPRFERSRILKPVDERPVWSIVCFFIAKPHRRRGLSVTLLRAAVDYAKREGAEVLEGYPNEPRKESAVDAFMYTGLKRAFDQVGFEEVARRSETRPIMRLYLA